MPDYSEEKEDEEVFYVEDWLSDETKIADLTWATMKEEAMQPKFNETEKFANLTEVEQQKVEALIEA